MLAGIQGRFSQAQFSYGLDEDSEGVDDFFSPVTHILADRGQQLDCDDFATMSQFWGNTAIEAGLLPEDERFDIVSGWVPASDSSGQEGAHAICVYFDPNGASYALDGTGYAGFRFWDQEETPSITTFAQ